MFGSQPVFAIFLAHRNLFYFVQASMVWCLFWANFSLNVLNPEFLIHRVFNGAVMTLLVEVCKMLTWHVKFDIGK